MRLLRCDDRGELSLTRDLSDDEIRIRPYAILSHTWGKDQDEIDLHEFNNGPDKSKAGYKKLQLCGEQARRDKLEYFWVDTCCIDKNSSSELSKNLNLMFRYYQESAKCYVYLSNVNDRNVEKEFRESNWFRRGWTLQELLAPRSVEFFSSQWNRLGDKATLEQEIHDITRIPLDALRGTDLSQFSVDERMSWTTHRDTKEKEDKAYCLLGIFSVSMAPRYGEGENAALARLKNKIRKNLKPTLQNIDGRIRDYYLRDGCLDIERLSGQRLPMESCFVNLGIVDSPDKSDRRKDSIDRDTNKFALAVRLNVETTQQSGAVTLKALFEPRKLMQGMVGQPKRIVIWGRAGMGKTTLCKKIIYDFLHKDLWQALYDRIFWLPLRRLKLIGNEAKTVAQMIQEVCFHGVGDGSLPTDILHDTLENSGNRCLFVLDGLDEVSYAIDPDSPMGANLHKLLMQENVIITSRPHGTSVLKRAQPDLEFETIGFFPKQVEEFLHREMDQKDTSPDAISAIRSFIKSRPIVQSLVRIPIQLDAICYAWNPEHFQQDEMTMTLLYNAISNRLWQKDIVRHDRKFDGEYITSQQIQSCTNIRHFVEPEISCLEELAFAGLYSQLVEFTSENINGVAGGQVPLLDSRLSKLSFLRSSENLAKSVNQTNHFIHLTFQEFFAAQYFVRHWLSGKAMVFPKMTPASTRHRKDMETITPVDFIRREKYSTRYDIFWRFVAGLLQMELGDEALNRFFKEIEAEPYDYLGFAHQLLVVHCLNEIVNSQDGFRIKAQELEHEYQKWVVFQSRSFDNSRALLEIAECPNSILKRWLGRIDAEKVQVMKALIKKPSVLFELLDAAIEEAQKTSNQDVRNHALAVIAKHCDQLHADVFSGLFAAQDIDVWSTAYELMPFGHVPGQLLIQNVAPLLQAENPQVLYSALKILRRENSLPEPTVDALVRLLQHPDSGVRSRAAEALEGQSSLLEPAIDALVRLLQDPDFHVQRWAARALERQRSLPEPVVDALVRLLQDSDSGVQSSAAWALEKQSSLPEPAVDALVRLLQDSDSDVPSLAAWALGGQSSLPEPAVDALVRLLQDSDSHVRRWAARALGGQSSLLEPVVDALVRRLQDSDSHVRCWAARALRGQSSLLEPAVDALVRLLQDPDSDVRSSAAIALGKQSSLPEPAVDTLVRLLQDSDSDVRSSAAIALGGQSSLPEPAVDALVRLLQDSDSDVQFSATRALERQRSLLEPAVDTLVRLLQDLDSDVRSSAAIALGGQSSLLEPAVDALVRLLQDPDSDVQSSATRALERQSSLLEPAVDALVRLLQDPDSDVRSSAARALGGQSSLLEPVVDALVRLLQDPDSDVRSSAAIALEGQSSLLEPAVDALVRLLQHPDSDLRSEAAIALRRQSTLSKSHVESLVQLLKSDISADVAVRVLEYRAEFYGMIIALDSVSLINLLRHWLKQCIKRSRYSYMVFYDEILLIEIDGKRWTVPFKSGEREVFKKRLLDAHKAIGTPLVRDSGKKAQVFKNKKKEGRGSWMKRIWSR